MTNEPLPFSPDPVLVLYTMEGCPFCVLAKQYLDAGGVRYVEAPVNDPDARKRFYALWNAPDRAQKAHASFPAAWVVWDGEATLVGGYQDIVAERLAENWTYFMGDAVPRSRLGEVLPPTAAAA